MNSQTPTLVTDPTDKQYAIDSEGRLYRRVRFLSESAGVVDLGYVKQIEDR